MLIFRHHPEGSEFIAEVNQQQAHLKYRVAEDPAAKIWDYYSTFVPDSLRGQRIGQELVQFGLDYAQTYGYKIIPTCSFVAKYLAEHPEYQSLIYKKV